MELQQSQTWQNLNAAFDAEARLTMLYKLYALRARNDGEYMAAQILEQAEKNEISHAALWFEYLNPAAPNTQQNLDSAAKAEHHEWAEAYSGYAQVARNEGFANIASLFDLVAGVEQTHEQAFVKHLTALEQCNATHSDTPAEWICQACGYHFTGTDAPELCPVCGKNHNIFKKSTPS